VQPFMPEGDDSDNRLTSRHLSVNLMAEDTQQQRTQRGEQ